MNNISIFVFLAGIIILNLIAFLLGNLYCFVPTLLNYTMVGVELFCLLLSIYARIKDFKNIDASIGIILNIFLTILLVCHMILYKSSS